ncbi:hypothetical protein FBQ87_14315 [Sphingobacteriales bacterium CHB3]|nr:hypothetical protein [Sphingobacteriales bacterium CHB3]
MQEYIDLIEDALQRIADAYFLLPTTYSRAGLTRERIFCYELYHQLRCLIGDNAPLMLHGEIDKRGHRDFALPHRANPDFVFHVPGTHERNTIVVEVKGNVDRAGIRKDFNTLLNFTEFYRYRLGIFVLFGHSARELRRLGKDVLLPLTQRPTANQILIMSIEKPHGNCEKQLLSDIRTEL